MTCREQALRKRIEEMAKDYSGSERVAFAHDEIRDQEAAYHSGAESLLPLLLEMAEALQAIIRSDGMWAGNNDNERYSSFSSWNERKKDIASEAISSLDRFLSGGDKP